MSEVDLKVKEGIPQTGVYTSDQGAVYLTDSNLQLMRIERAWARVDNGVGVYRESGKRSGITYAGTPRVVGQINRAFVNMSELKMSLGVEGSDSEVPIGPGVLTGPQLEKLVERGKTAGDKFPWHTTGKNWYPIRCDIGIVINATEELSIVDANDSETPSTLSAGYGQSLFAKNCIINNYSIVYDARGLITSGPMDFLGSSAEWRIETTD